MDGSGSSDLSFLYEMLNLGSDGYATEISQVVDRTFCNSPRTAVSVKEILTPRTPTISGENERAFSREDNLRSSGKSVNSGRREHLDTPVTPRRFGNNPVSVVYHRVLRDTPRNSLSLSSGSSWPELSSIEQENLKRQLQNHLHQQQHRRNSDLGMSPITPRSGSTDLPPYRSARTSSNTPRALTSIKEQSGSNLSLNELRNFKLYERSLPRPKPQSPLSAESLRRSSSFRESKAGYGQNEYVLGPGFDNFASLTASGPGARRENGVHVPYLDIPVTSRSNTLKTHEFLSELLSGYQTTSTNASSTLYNSQSRQNTMYSDRAVEVRGSIASQGLPGSEYLEGIDDIEAKSGPAATPSEAWTRRDKMLLVGLICVALIVILLAVIVLLVAVGVVKEDGDSTSSESSGQILSGSGESGSQIIDVTERPSLIDNVTMTNYDGVSSNSSLEPGGQGTPSTAAVTYPSTTEDSFKSQSTLPSTSSPNSGSGGLQQISSTEAPTSPLTETTRNGGAATSRATPSTTLSTTPSTTTKISTIKTTPTTTSKPPTATTSKSTAATSTSTSTATSKATTATTTTTTTTTPTTTTTSTTTTPTTTTTTTTTENPLASLVYSSCSTQECEMFSNTIKGSMNTTAPPCVSFHDYACGNRMVSHKQPRAVDTVTSLHEMVSNDLYTRAVGYLSQLDTNSASEDERVAGAIYQACLLSNSAENEDEEVSALLASLDLSPGLTLPLSFDLLLRRAQDNFGVNPFLTTQRAAQFDGSVYQYVTRVTLPRLTFPDEEYEVDMLSSQAARIYIDSLSYIIKGLLDVEATSSGSRGKREAGPIGGDDLDIGMNMRRKRQVSGITLDTIKARVSEALSLEWDIATLVRNEMDQRTQYLVRQLSVRTVQNLIPQLPWVLLTDLSLIDTVQISGLSYLQSVNTLLEAADPQVVKMLVYVQCVVSLLPYMPSTIRSQVHDAKSGIERVYTEESCSRLTMTVAFEETMDGLKQWQPLGYQAETQRATEIATEAVSKLRVVYNRYNAADQFTKQNILSDLSSMRVKIMDLDSNLGSQHSSVSLSSLPESSTSLVSIAQTVLTHKRSMAASEALGSPDEEEGLPQDSLHFSPIVNAAEGSLALPAGFVLLSRWAQDADFLEEFFSTFVYRSLIDFVLRKHLFSESYLQTHSCSLRPFRNVYTDNEPETTESIKEMQISVLTEAAVQGMLYRNVERSTTAAVKLGSDFYYERDITYLSYAQNWCSSSYSHLEAEMRDFVQPDLLLDQTMRKDYRSSNYFYQCQRPSCFFWAQGDNSEGEGT